MRQVQQRRKAGHCLLRRELAQEVSRQRRDRLSRVRPPHRHGHITHCSAVCQTRGQVKACSHLHNLLRKTQ